MKVLHFHMKTDTTSRQYIEVLTAAMACMAETKSCSSLKILRKELSSWHPDIVHLHGCWHLSIALAATMARKQGIRTIITPHGQLEPWILKQQYWTEKLPKLQLYQRRCLQKAYCMIAMGRLEAGNLSNLGYNKRVETVLNAIVTDTITPQEMATQVYAIYMKVLDSDVHELMSPGTRLAMRAIIKAGITGDKHWLTEQENRACMNISHDECHKIAVFACQENINGTIEHGISTLKPGMPFTLYETIDSYVAPTKPMGKLAQSLDHEEQVVELLETTYKYARRKMLRISHLIEISTLIRNAKVNEDKLGKLLQERKLMKHASRLMQILADTTGLEEGFMIATAINDRVTRKTETEITKRIRI